MAAALSRPWRLPAAVVPVLAAFVVVAVGGLSISGAHRALGPLGSPIAFLLAAVPLAVLLDRLGFFTALAGRLSGAGRGPGGLWVLAALVTTVLNLDASVVLLTPLYVRIAHRRQWDPLTLAFQPVLLACLASSALPVSNLTNLIGSAATGAGTVDFVTHLALPSLAATSVGWVCYRRVCRAGLVGSLTVGAPPTVDLSAEAERRALLVGGMVVIVVLAGFTAGRSAGLQPWMVALAADAFLIGILRRVPLRQIPVGTALVAASLGVLAAAAAGHLPVRQLLAGHDIASLARTTGVTALAANVVNNLPALLITLPTLGHRISPTLWAVLLGVNMGPVLLITGSLASLLWLDALGRLGVKVRAWDFTRVGALVGLPAAAAALGVHLGLRASGLI
ncbi:MAG: SLC13 family permease [Actinomycetota bacterium]|nr:SLC13 family permease [Actinomycetota bacterium]